METLILGWYILSATGSVEYLVAFGALTWLGAIGSPLFAIAADRFGVRNFLCTTRAIYAALAAVLMILTLANALQPWHVFAIYAAAALTRPSETAMRALLVGHTVRPEIMMGALGLSRATVDLAKVAGAFAGAGGVALVGMGPAYVLVTALYVTAFALSLNLARTPIHAGQANAAALVNGIKDAARYVWTKPDLLGAFSVAFLVNLLAFPFFLGLLPYAAKEVYAIGQTGLGWLAGAFALGALAGSLAVGANTMPLRAGRAMLAATALWFVAIALFGQTRSLPAGLALLFFSGVVQSFCVTPLATVILRGSSIDMVGRVMGLRILAIWGLPLGLLATGPIIAQLGYSICTALYAAAGLAATAAIASRLRAALWDGK
jgi:predicted MFS family arabinose efflux permease